MYVCTVYTYSMFVPLCVRPSVSQRELRPLIQAGVAGFKCFLIPSGVDEFPHVEESDLHTAMKQLQGTGSVLLVAPSHHTHHRQCAPGSPLSPHPPQAVCSW